MGTGLLPHLETFILAAEHGSFTAAARLLAVTQAAVSQRVSILEAELGVSLFSRQGGRVSLNEAGRLLHAYAQRIVALHQEARALVSGREEPLVGELVLAASSVPGEHLLPGLLSEFRLRQPRVMVRATVADSGAALAEVEQGLAHLGLVGRPAEHQNLDQRRFAHDRMVIVVSSKHPWAQRESVPLAELCQEPLVLREAGSGSRSCLERALSLAGKSVADLTVALELGSNEGTREAVARGLGVAVLSEYAVDKETQAGRLHALSVADLPMRRDLFVVWDRRRALPIPAQLFLDMLESLPEAIRSP